MLKKTAMYSYIFKLLKNGYVNDLLLFFCILANTETKWLQSINNG